MSLDSVRSFAVLAAISVGACYGSRQGQSGDAQQAGASDGPSRGGGSDASSSHRRQGDVAGVDVQLSEPFTISDPDQQAGPPTVRFVDGRWRVAWQAEGWEDRLGHLETATIDRDLQPVLRRSGPSVSESWPELRFDAEGRLGVLYDGSSCVHQLHGADLRPIAPGFAVPCGRDDYRAAAAPVPDSDAWLIAYGNGELSGDIVVGRYEPTASTWMTPQVVLGPRTPEAPLDVFTSGSRAFVIWGNRHGSTLRRFQLQGPSNPTTLTLARSSISDGAYNLAELEDRTLLMGIDDGGLWSVALDRSGLIEETQISQAVAIDRRPGMAAAPELGVVGVCYGVSLSGRPEPGGSLQGDAAAFLLLDRNGAVLGAPRIFAERVPNFGGCDIAWSGEQFLVVYWHIDLTDDLDATVSDIVVQPIDVEPMRQQ